MTTNKSDGGEPVPYDEQKEMFRNAFNVFPGTYEEYDLMEEHMAEVCVQELNFTDSTVVFDSDIDLEDLEDED